MEERECIICHKMFVPEHFNQKRCKGPHFKCCPVCGKEMPWTEYDRCCSKKCTREKTKSTNLKKFGVESPINNEEVKAKSKATCLSHHGVEYPSQNRDIKRKQLSTFHTHYGKEINPEGFSKLDEKRKATCLEKYGTEYSFQSENNKQKSRETSLQKYGTEYPMQNEEVKEIFKESMLEKYGVDNAMKIADVAEKARKTLQTRYGFSYSTLVPEIKDKIVATNLDRYGVPWYCMTEDCKKASGKIISKLNESFSKFLTDASISHEMEFRINNYSYDFKIGSILIEIDPSFTHNCAFNPFDRNRPGLDIDYHVKKSKVAEEAGYRCIHIFDWDDWSKVLSCFLEDSKNVYARKCKVKAVSDEDCREFLQRFHFQGSCKGQEIRLGLYDVSDELVEVMTFGKPRYNSKYQWELLRLCTRLGSKVVGGASKLLTNFIREYDPESIISYCDRSKFTGRVYSSIGFSLCNYSEPAKIWYKNGKRITDNLLRQRGYDQLFGTAYGKGTSNEELMLKNYWLPVFDCGQYVFEWRRK